LASPTRCGKLGIVTTVEITPATASTIAMSLTSVVPWLVSLRSKLHTTIAVTSAEQQVLHLIKYVASAINAPVGSNDLDDRLDVPFVIRGAAQDDVRLSNSRETDDRPGNILRRDRIGDQPLVRLEPHPTGYTTSPEGLAGRPSLRPPPALVVSGTGQPDQSPPPSRRL